MTQESLNELAQRRSSSDVDRSDALCAVPPTKDDLARAAMSSGKDNKKPFISSLPSSHSYLPSLASGLANHHHPTLVMGVQSDSLFPVEQQRELAESIRANGNKRLTYYELASGETLFSPSASQLTFDSVRSRHVLARFAKRRRSHQGILGQCGMTITPVNCT